MSAWKELQLALANDSVTDEELEEYKQAWEQECREDYDDERIDYASADE